MKELLDIMDMETLSKLKMNFYKMVVENQPHIKKYYRIRKLHADVLMSMEKYMGTEYYDVDYYFRMLIKQCSQKLNFNIELDNSDYDDHTILEELFVYKQDKNVQSITEIYLDKKKFRNKDKIKMLESMNNSIVSLFKVVGIDKVVLV